MAIDWSTIARGTSNYNAYGTNTNPYDEQYAQTKRNISQTAGGILPFDQFAFRGIQPIQSETQEITGIQKTLPQIYNEAQQQYLARSAERQTLGRQSILAGGQDRYQQARLAMEQQRALSDTRGLTAGAAEGASQQLSATQQVALNQIESTTRAQLNELKAQGVQDEFLAQEYALRQVDIFKQTSPEWGLIESKSDALQFAMASGNMEEATQIQNELSLLKAQAVGLDEATINKFVNTSSTPLELRAATEDAINQLLEDPSAWDKVLAGLAIAGGITAAAAGVLMAPFTAGVSTGATVGGVGLITAGLVTLGFGINTASIEKDQELSVAEKREKLNQIFAEEAKYYRELGYTQEQINTLISERRKTLAPVYQ